MKGELDLVMSGIKFKVATFMVRGFATFGACAWTGLALISCAPSSNPQLSQVKSAPAIKSQVIHKDERVFIAHEFFLRARQQEMDGNDAVALSYYQIAYEYDTDSRDLCFLLTDKLKASGKMDSALATGLRCLKLKGTATSHEYQALAEIQLRKNNIKNALVLYNQAVELNEDDKDLLYTLATLYESLKDIPKHVAFMERLLPKVDYPERLLEKQVQNYRALGKVDAIPNLYKAAWEKMANPIFGEKLAAFYEEQEMLANHLDVVRQLGRENPDNLQYEIQKARAFILAGQADSATIAYASLVERNPEDRDLSATYATLLFENKRFAEAKDLFQKLAKAQPDDPVYHFFLGSIFMELKENQAAEAELKWAIELEAKVPEYWAKLAALYIQSGQEQKALDLIQKMGEGKDWHAHYIQGIIFTRVAKRLEQEKKVLVDSVNVGESQGQIRRFREKGIESFRKALSLEAQNRRVLFELSIALEQVHKRAESIETLKKLVKIDSSDATTLNYLGYMLVEESAELEYAGALIEKALKFEPDNGAFLDSKGWLFFQKKDFVQARKYIEMALERIPQDTTILEHYALILEKLGQGDAAMEKWRQILKLDPEHALALRKLN